jgi:thioredoxin-related protein
MRNLLTAALLVLCNSIVYSQSAKITEDSLTWHSDVNEVYHLSQTTNKPVFAFFTGSDWCGWCHKLQREVFSKPEFIKWANNHVILLELDYPRKKQLPQALAQQNQSLQQFFQVTGFPTIWIFSMSQDSDNKKFLIAPFGSLGYPAGAETGREEIKFLDNANSVLVKKK